MKFSDGFWRDREGMDVYNVSRVYDVEIDENSINAFAPYYDVQNRGQTLTGPLLSYRFSSPMDGVIRVQMWHFKGALRKGPFFDFENTPQPKVEISDDEAASVLRSGSLSVRVGKGHAWNLEFQRGGRTLTNSRWKNSGYIVVSGAEGPVPYMKEELSLGVGELVYGLGERFTAFVKNGQVVDSWNADGGTSSELSYKNVPFYLSSRGYGIFVNDPGRVSFEVASEKVERVQFSVRGEYLEYYVIDGPGPKEVLSRYAALTGRPAPLPAWSFGLWLSTSFITEYDEKTVTSFIDGMAERGIPLSVFHFDCFWMQEYHWTNFRWNKKYFPDPEGFLARLKERGLKICVWINPYIAQRSELFEEGAREGYLLRKPDGGVWQTEAWQPGMGIVDFSSPKAREWFASKIESLLDSGVDCVKTDFGERIPEDVQWADGSDPERMHNYYSYLYNKTVFEALEKKRGRGDAIVFARAGTAGSQKFPVHWGGDCTASYESMAESLRGGLSLCLSGFGFWSHDISGFELTATPDLYKRWAAFGLLSSHSRLHGNSSYRVPWLFDEEAVGVVRFFSRLKCRLMPYLWEAAREASSEGIPMMRAMILEFPDDPACAYLDRQYFLGGSLLVAPVFSSDGEAAYYLPEGGWTNILSGERIEGACWRKESHGYLSLPLLARDGTLLAWGERDDTTDYAFTRGLTLSLYGLQDGGSACAEVRNQSGDEILRLRAERKGGSILLKADGSGAPTWSLELHGMGAASAKGMKIVSEGGKNRVLPEKSFGEFSIQVDGK